ncbi:Major sperm protein [Dirofilaria immitis]|nr:Major sperm protein [Dirofilaria immitis]
MTSINSTISNGSKLSSRTIDNQGNKKREIIITTQNIPIVQTDEKIQKLSDIQTQEKIQKLSDIQSQEKIQKLSDMQWEEKIQQLPIKQSSENVYPELLFQQTTSPIDSSCKCSGKKAIIENELLTSSLGRSTSSNASFTNQHDLLLKDNDSQETKSSNNSNVLQHKDDNDDVSEHNALMIDDIIIFPSEIKWKLKNTVQRVQLQNPTENRFAIKLPTLMKYILHDDLVLEPGSVVKIKRALLKSGNYLS